MIFSDSEREHYRKELEAASKAGDVERVRRLIDNIRLLGDIRENVIKSTGIQADHFTVTPCGVPPEILYKLPVGIQEYIKQQKALNEELDEHNALNYPDENPYGLLPFPEDILGDDDIALTDRAEVPFRGVLQQGFKDSGWTW